MGFQLPVQWRYSFTLPLELWRGGGGGFAGHSFGTVGGPSRAHFTLSIETLSDSNVEEEQTLSVIKGTRSCWSLNVGDVGGRGGWRHGVINFSNETFKVIYMDNLTDLHHIQSRNIRNLSLTSKI